MTVNCGYCSRTFETSKERDEHRNRIHKTEMLDIEETKTEYKT